MRTTFAGIRSVSRLGWPVAALLLALWPSVSRGQYVLEDVFDPKRYKPDTLVVPVAYYSSSLEAAAGFAGYTNGLFQPQVQEYEFGIGSYNGSYGGVVGLNSLQLYPINRLFFDFDLTYFRTQEDQNTVNGDPGFPHEQAGSNKSSEFDYIESRSTDLIGNFTFKYLLPIGNGKDVIVDHYRLHEGLLESGAGGGGDWFNPLTSGRTFLELSPRFEYMDIRAHSAQRHLWNTDNLRFSFVYDNRDWPLTPSQGNQTTVSITRDFGVLGSSNPWTTLSAELSQYIPLGQSTLFRQQVLALDGWTSYSPTWHQRGRPGNLDISTAPPFFDGAELGGMNRMRGYPEERFHDRAGMYGCAELRLIPYWNPLREIPAFKSSDIAWIQFVAFLEVGRVADNFTFDKLFNHVKHDGGIGLRILTQDTVVRFDLATSSEGVQFWANLDQAF